MRSLRRRATPEMARHVVWLFVYLGVALYRLIGAIVGFYFLHFFGAVLGYFIGSILDRARVYGVGGVNPFTKAQRQAVFLDTTFILMGKLAKVDGQISQDEISYVEHFMHTLGMSAEHRQQGIALFKRGSAPGFDIAPTVSQFIAVCGHTQSLPQTLLTYLIVMAIADGRIDAAEEQLLQTLAAQLGYDQATFYQLRDMILNQAQFANGQAQSATALDDAYKALGLTKESSDQEVKRAYRKLISQYHPDKLMGQGLPQDMIAVATEKAKEVQLAYDLIMKSRAS